MKPPHPADSAPRLPILTFHALDDRDDVASFSPSRLQRALAHWHAAEWRTIPLTDAVQLLSAGAQFPARRFCLTFDDGYASVYRVAFPLLQQYGMTAAVFISPGAPDVPHRADVLPTIFNREMLRWSEIREMHAYGILFGAHTLTHPDLLRLPAPAAAREIRDSQSFIADTLGAPVRLFAYPYGRWNKNVRELVAASFDAACSDRLGLVHKQSDPFALERVETFYLRAPWAASAITRPWFPLYLYLCNLPRLLRRAVRP